MRLNGWQRLFVVVSVVWAVFVYQVNGLPSQLDPSVFVHRKLVLDSAKQRAIALAERYADWMVKNADKRGTDEFSSVADAYEQAKKAASLGQGSNHHPDKYDKLAEKYGGWREAPIIDPDTYLESTRTGQVGPWSKYQLDGLYKELRQADADGNTAKAIRLALEITELRAQLSQKASAMPQAYTMNDGVQINTNGYVYTRSEYLEAYQKALPEIKAAQTEMNFSHWSSVASMYFSPLVALYLLGWSVAWVRRGFRKPVM